MRLLGGAVLVASATLGLTVLVSSFCPQYPHWGYVAAATLCGAVAGILWQRSETKKEENSNITIQHLTSQLRKKGVK